MFAPKYFITIEISLIFLYVFSFNRAVTPDKAGIAGMMAAFFLILGILTGLYFTLFVAYVNEHLGPLVPIRLANVTEPVNGIILSE